MRRLNRLQDVQRGRVTRSRRRCFEPRGLHADEAHEVPGLRSGYSAEASACALPATVSSPVNGRATTGGVQRRVDRRSVGVVLPVSTVSIL